jgi:hypothetical protein
MVADFWCQITTTENIALHTGIVSMRLIDTTPAWRKPIE